MGVNSSAAIKSATLKVVTETVDHVPPLFEALAAKDYDKVTQIKDGIFATEDRADKIKYIRPLVH